MIYIMNSPIITNEGVYSYNKVRKETAVVLLQEWEWKSAIGHKPTADFLSKILDIEIPSDRIEVKMGIGDQALVFRLVKRLPEGVVLSQDELDKTPFELGVMMYKSPCDYCQHNG